MSLNSCGSFPNITISDCSVIGGNLLGSSSTNSVYLGNGCISNVYIGALQCSTGYSNTIAGYGSYYNDVTSELVNLVEYTDFVFKIMGIDMSFDKFKEMSELERKSFLRDIKINKIIK